MAETISVDMVVEAITKGFDRVLDQYDDLADKSKKNEEQNKKTTLSFTDLNQAIELGGKLIESFKKGYEFAREGAEIQALEGRFSNLSASIGGTADALLGDLRNATSGMISDAELMSGASDLIELGLAKTQDETILMSELVGKLGLDLQVLGLTIANESTARLDSLGLSMETVKAKTQEYVDAGFDKHEAFKMSVLDGLQDRLALVGDTADTNLGVFMRFETALQNVGDTAKSVAANALTPYIEQLNFILTASDELNEKMTFDAAVASTDELTQKAGQLAELRDGISFLGLAFTGTADETVKAINSIARQMAVGQSDAEVYRQSLYDAFGENTASDIIRSIRNQGMSLDEYIKRVNDTTEAHGKYRDGLELTNAEMGAWEARIAQIVPAVTELSEITDEERESMIALGAAAFDLGNEFDESRLRAVEFNIIMQQQEAALVAAEEAARRQSAAYDAATGGARDYQGEVFTLTEMLNSLAGEYQATVDLRVYGLADAAAAAAFLNSIQNPDYGTEYNPYTGEDTYQEAIDAIGDEFVGFEDAPSVPPPPTQGGGGYGAQSVGSGVTINVYPSQGMNETQLANAVSQRLAQQARQFTSARR